MPDTTKNSPTHFIGIGASAGGLEALQDFFSNISNISGATFVVVQHLSPDFKSMMPELLAKHTEMPIFLAEDKLLIEKDTIYLMPPRTNMSINDGRLAFLDKKEDGRLHLPVDVFLCSLAEDQKHRAIGIVLSGTGSDGTRGIKALKESGGLVIVQEPSSAKFDGMPISAFNTGLADLVLPPKLMGENLANFINHPIISGSSPSLKNSLNDNVDLLSNTFELLKKHCSINFALYKASTVARRIERRMGINQMTTLDAYVQLLNNSHREVQTLSKELLIGVTNFFRDDDAFHKITNDVIPGIVAKAKAKNEDIRLWIAGCSSGEEAYSLAMLFDEEMVRQEYETRIKVFATDVDDRAIAFASAGVYSEDIVHEVSPERLSRYFNCKGNQYVVGKHLRQMVIFAVHNMIEDAPFSNLNLVSCRNVLIYFQHTAQKKVLSSLYFSLKKNGCLFLGSSEFLGDLHTHFKVLDERLKIFSKISNVRVPLSNMSPLRDSVSPQTYYTAISSSTAQLTSQRTNARTPLSKVQDRIIKEYAPDCIVLNDMFDAIHVYGDVSLYTRGVKEGKISNSIKDMVVEDLSIAITTALHRCEQSGEDVFYKDVLIRTSDKKEVSIDLTIFIVKESELPHSANYFVVQFIQSLNIIEAGSVHLEKKVPFDLGQQTRQRISDLEQELTKKQEHLQITVEELETTNEELQSANEELMSANEELQSTNEELQSVNEELYTVNSEYQEKIFELTETNDDLDGVINATEIGIIFLDKELSVRKYTPHATDYFNIRDQDLGRPFDHISNTLIYEELVNDVAKVNNNGKPSEHEVIAQNGNVLLMKILPYIRADRKERLGVLITITNISKLRFIEDALAIAQEKVRSYILESSLKLSGRITKKENIKLLLVDDSAVDRALVNDFLSGLKNRNYEVTQASSISEAVTISKKNQFDILLVDYDLDAGTAKDLAKKLKESNQEVPMIILSGYSEDGLDADFLSRDVMDFLNKNDLSAQLLSNSIDYVLERDSVHKQLDNIIVS